MTRHLILLFVICTGCTAGPERYFFLSEYPHLTLTDLYGNRYPEQRYIQSAIEYGVLTFDIRSRNALLIERDTGEPYNGFVRTYYDDLYNLEASFQDGYMQRIRVWHPNRALAMDRDFSTGSGSAWDSQGRLAVNWTPDETQVRNLLTGTMIRLVRDSVTWYFDAGGDVDWYSVQGDLEIIQYYADSTPRFQYPTGRFGRGSGPVKRWYRNGTLHVEGYYTNGRESGIWIEYDRDGNIITKREYPSPEQN